MIVVRSNSSSSSSSNNNNDNLNNDYNDNDSNSTSLLGLHAAHRDPARLHGGRRGARARGAYGYIDK